MSIFYDKHIDALCVKCDCCNEKRALYGGVTDKTWAHGWIKENGWKTVKIGARFEQLCPECKELIKRKKQESYLRRINA